MVRRAAAYLSGGDAKAAALSARRALQMNPGNASAIRIMADIADRDADPSAVDWWRKVVNLQPHRASDVLAFVRAALRVHDAAAAELALDGLEQDAKQTAEYYAASAQLAVFKKNTVAAESNWQTACDLAPNQKDYQLQLALVRLDATDAAKRDLGRKTLSGFRNDPKQRAAATRALILDGLAHNNATDNLQSLGSELAGYSEALFADRLLYLDVLRRSQDPALDEYLKDLEQEATSQPDNVANLLSWMNNNENSPTAIVFSRSLPADMRNTWPVGPAIATAYVSLKDWAGLEQLTASTEWSQFDFLRHAFRSRALREQEKKFEAEQEWVAAQKAAFSQPQSLLLLTRTTAAWGWEAEKVELLWLLTKANETKLPALRALYEHYGGTSDTVGLYRTLVRLVELMPEDLILQNNLAQVSLLLRTDVDRATRIAADLKNKAPSNGAFVSTYAFSLWTRGDLEGARRAMDQLGQEQLRDPSVAVYYGVILAAVGQREKAQEYLRNASQAHLLPEERALVAKAKE